MCNIFDLENMAGVRVLFLTTLSGKEVPIVIYEDHRTIINVLFRIRKMGKINESVNVIYFDRHDDALDPDEMVIEYSQKFDPLTADERDFFSLVEFNLSSNDDDWLVSGMHLNLIKDALSIGMFDNFKSNKVVIDHLGNSHRLIQINHLSETLCYKGSLIDHLEGSEEIKVAKRMLGFNIDNSREFIIPENKYIVDFDLDCFTLPTFRNYTFPWPESIFKDEFQSLVYNEHYNVSCFINKILDNAELVTMCYESKYTGGINNSNLILNQLNKYVFNNSLTLRDDN